MAVQAAAYGTSGPTAADTTMHGSQDPKPGELDRRHINGTPKSHLLYRTRRMAQITALVATFLAYAGYHSTRKSFSNIKSTLGQPYCDLSRGHHVFGQRKELCCKGPLVPNSNASAVYNVLEICKGGASHVCSLASGTTTRANTQANFISNLFDVGQILGGAAGGLLSDYIGSRAPVVVGFMLPAAASLLFFPSATLAALFVLIPLSGFLLGGPANLISSAIASDLGNHPTIIGDSEALGTVTGIIDGTGSLGAAVGQYFVGALANVSRRPCYPFIYGNFLRQIILTFF